MSGEFFSSILLPLIYPMFTCLDPDPYSGYESGSGFTKFLNTDLIWMRIHNIANNTTTSTTIDYYPHSTVHTDNRESKERWPRDKREKVRFSFLSSWSLFEGTSILLNGGVESLFNFTVYLLIKSYSYSIYTDSAVRLGLQ